MAKEMINLCEKCNCDYEKPSVFQKYFNVFTNGVYRSVIAVEENGERGFKSLPEVLKALGA